MTYCQQTQRLPPPPTAPPHSPHSRPDYLATFLSHLVDWKAAEERYSHVLAEEEE